MAKLSKEEQLNARLQEIDKLKKTLAETRARLMQLTGLADKTTEASLPDNFKDQIIEVLREGGKSMSTNEVTDKIEGKTGVTVPRKNVQSTLDNTVKQGTVIKEGKGRGNVRYSLKQ